MTQADKQSLIGPLKINEIPLNLGDLLDAAIFYRVGRSGRVHSNGLLSRCAWLWKSRPKVLLEFLDLQKLPLGPLLLRDFGDHLFFSKDSRSHKKSNIKMILDSFLRLPFVLIGDSGERDPEIYTDVVKEYSTRIRVIYIGSINKHASRLAAIDKLIDEVQHLGTQLVLTPDSEFAAAHAAAEGLIATAEVAAVRSEKKRIRLHQSRRR